MFPAASALSPMHLAILLNVLATSALVIGFVPTEPSRLMARKTGPFLIFIARRHSSRAIRASRARWRSWMTPPLVRRVTVRPSGPFEETSAVLSAALQQRNNQTHGVWTLGAADQARRPLRRCSAPRQCEPEATAERCQRACARSGSVIGRLVAMQQPKRLFASSGRGGRYRRTPRTIGIRGFGQVPLGAYKTFQRVPFGRVPPDL